MLNKYLGQLLSDHQIKYSEVDGKYQIADGITISAQTFKGVPGAELSIQGDYTLKVGEKAIIESFALPADDNEDDICKQMTDYFDAASFHVMMSYVFGKKDEQNNYEEWNFHGKKRKLIIGHVSGKFANELIQTDLHLNDFYVWAQDYIQYLKLDQGLNWIRVFVFQMKGEIVAAELLIKNQLVPEFLEYIRSKPFIKANGFYSYRNFMIIRENEDPDKFTGVLTFEDLAIEILRMADENPRIGGIEIVKFIARNSDDPQDPVLSFGFFQSGLVRRVINKLGSPFSKVQLSEEYLIFDANGTITETGKLIDQEWYNMAFSVPEYCITHNNIMNIVMTSAEINVMDDFLKKGENLGDCTFGPVAQFSSEPTSMGKARALAIIEQRLRDQKKPWWKIW